MDLFSAAAENDRQRAAPLAARMRPQTLDEIVGQQELIGPGTLLRRAIEADRVPSLILYGPPGSGKTTLARVIASTTKAYFVPINAVASGVAELRKTVEDAKQRLGMHGRRTIAFVDEIHRFNRSQQDALLPAVEDGTVILIGATTENPFFSVNRPLLSRCRIFQLQPIDDASMVQLLKRALIDTERGLGEIGIEADAEALAFLAHMANGDVRIALNALEFCAVTAGEGPPKGTPRITLAAAQTALQRRNVPFAKDDEHYDVTSCFVKSMRGSDPDATLYWLGRMIYAGEDAVYIARRIMVHAAEDVGLADPQALVIASAAATAAERVGLPEARIILAQAALYVAMAPKSNSVVVGIDRALKAVEENPMQPPPASMRDAHYQGAEQLGAGVGYRYPHDYPNHWVSQQYLPDVLKKATFYEPSQSGREPQAWQMLEQRKKPPS